MQMLTWIPCLFLFLLYTVSPNHKRQLSRWPLIICIYGLEFVFTIPLRLRAIQPRNYWTSPLGCQTCTSKSICSKSNLFSLSSNHHQLLQTRNSALLLNSLPSLSPLSQYPTGDWFLQVLTGSLTPRLSCLPESVNTVHASIAFSMYCHFP